MAITKCCKERLPHKMHKVKRKALTMWWTGKNLESKIFVKPACLGRDKNAEAPWAIGGLQSKQTGSYLKPDACRIFARCGVPGCFSCRIFLIPWIHVLLLDNIIINMVIGCERHVANVLLDILLATLSLTILSRMSYLWKPLNGDGSLLTKHARHFVYLNLLITQVWQSNQVRMELHTWAYVSVSEGCLGISPPCGASIYFKCICTWSASPPPLSTLHIIGTAIVCIR